MKSHPQRDSAAQKTAGRLRRECELLKRKLAVLRGASRMRSAMVSVVAHEVRAPLAIARESLGVLRRSAPGERSGTHHELLERAFSQIEHAGKITDMLFDLSRIERGIFKLQYSLVNLNDLIRDICKGLRVCARDKGVALSCALPRDPINIFIDPERIGQVILNLMDNGIKFTPRGGRVGIQTQIMENKVRVKISDSGIGIEPRYLNRIFERGFQVPLKGKQKGLGLGLTIAREFTRRHGGEIWVESAPDKGSDFYFTLPRFYSTNVLDKDTRGRINQLLEQNVSLHLINLLIINYGEFRRLVHSEGAGILDDIRRIIFAVTEDLCAGRRSGCEIFLGGFTRGACTIIFPDAAERDVASLCGALRERLDAFLTKHKIKDSFVNIGVLEFMYKTRPFKETDGPVSIFVKKIFIGANKRGSARVSCHMPIEPVALDAALGGAYTLDISRGGLCFISTRQLKTDSRLLIKLNLPRRKQALSLTGRVAWISPLEKTYAAEPRRFKIGLEFVGVSKDDAAALGSFISAAARQVGARHAVPPQGH